LSGHQRPRIPFRCSLSNLGTIVLEGRLRLMNLCEFRLELHDSSLGVRQFFATLGASLLQLHAPKVECSLPVAASPGKIAGWIAFCHQSGMGGPAKACPGERLYLRRGRCFSTAAACAARKASTRSS